MKRFTSVINGDCHCGNITFEFRTNIAPDALVVRNCQCRFCRAHGAATARDPNGLASINARDSDAVTLYRFATKTTDFVLCSFCGVYVGATVTYEGQTYATLNMNITTLNTTDATPIVHDDELSERRIARRVNSFTPLVDYPF